MTPYDRVFFSVSGVPGTGIITAGAPVPTFRTMAGAGIPDATVASYVMLDGAAIEYGHGLTGGGATTLARTPIFSTNANAPINASSQALVFLTILAEDYGALAFLGVGTGLSIGGGLLNVKDRKQRAAAGTSIVVASDDEIINCTMTGASTCTIPISTSRTKTLTFKDCGGVLPVTFSFTGGELADGVGTVKLALARQEISFRPFTDGTNTGYALT